MLIYVLGLLRNRIIMMRVPLAWILVNKIYCKIY
jgi:hypothetical protein